MGAPPYCLRVIFSENGATPHQRGAGIFRIMHQRFN